MRCMWTACRQSVRTCAAGASGHLVDVVVYSGLLAYVVAAAGNCVWNRLWSFRTRQVRIVRRAEVG